MRGKAASPSDLEAFQQWLGTKPREWSVVIAARAALRVLPLARTAKFGSEEARTTLLRVFRATAIARFAAVYPNRTIEALVAARAATARAPVYVTNAAAAAAADALAAAIFARAAADIAVRFAADATFAADAAFEAYTAIRRDALDLVVGDIPPDRLARAPLWQLSETGVALPPADMFGMWVELRSDLLRLDEHWQAWIDWYEDVIAGSPPSPARSEAWEAAFTDVQHPSYPWTLGRRPRGCELRDQGAAR